MVLGIAALSLTSGCGSKDDDTGEDATAGGGAGGEATMLGNDGDEGDTDPLAVPSEPCTDQEVACNGQCLSESDSENGCHFLVGQEAGIYEFVLSDDGIYAATESGVPRTYSIVTLDKTTLAEEEKVTPEDPSERAVSLAVSETHVGWLEEDAASFGVFSLNSAPKGGEPLSDLFSGELSGIYATPDGWLARSSGFNVNDELYVVPFDGGDPTLIGMGADWLSSNIHQVLDGYYYFERDGLSNDDAVFRLPIDGGDAESMVTAKSIYSFHADDSHLYVVQGAYSGDPRHISRLPLGGGDLEDVSDEFFTGGEHLYGQGEWLYFPRRVEGSDGAFVHTIVGQPKQGGAETIVAASPAPFDHLAVDATGLYFLQSKKLVRVDLAQ